MQKLQLSFKILSEVPRNLSNKKNLFLESHLCNNLVVSLRERNPIQLFNSSITQHHLFSRFSSNPSRSWRSCHGVSKKYYGFLENPLFLKQLVSNTHFKNRSRNAFAGGILFLKTQFPKRHFQINPMFNSSRRRWRSWFLTDDNMVYGLIAANVAVFVLWKIADPTFMTKHFTISVENFTSGRVHTLITHAFSHIQLEHLFSNMLGLYFFGTKIGRYFGSEFLLKLYLAGAVGGSIFYLAHHAYLASSSKGSRIWHMDPKKVPGLGGSGAVNAIILLDIFLFPTATIYFDFFIPVPAFLMGAFFIGIDLWRMRDQRDSHISGAAHLGGAVVAALVWARIKKRWI